MACLLPDRLRRHLADIDPDTVRTVEKVRREDAHIPVPHRKVLFCVSEECAYRAVLDEQSISSITIDLDRQLVSKHVEAFADFGIVEREAGWLAVLAETGIAPRLVSAAPGRLLLTYVGEPVRAHNLPADWVEQAGRILALLASAGCAHNDIKCDNLTVAAGRIHLIDYGWATRIGEPIPRHWPHGIGRQHRLDIHQFDDSAAIMAALASAENGKVDRSVVMHADHLHQGL